VELEVLVLARKTTWAGALLAFGRHELVQALTTTVDAYVGVQPIGSITGLKKAPKLPKSN
jgi:hypothetical protein